MRGVTGLALIFALVLGMLTLSSVLAAETAVASLTGGFGDFFVRLPTLFIFVMATVAVMTAVGFVGMFFSRR